MPAAHDVRLGHALRGGADAVEEAVDVVRGARPLLPRVPADPRAVDAAEAALGIAPEARPVYGYVGDLQPALGTVGLVIKRSWLRALTGVTRCDTGGLVGRRGSFEVLDGTQVTDAVHALTFSGPSLSTWESAFEVEVTTSYDHDAPGYVNGDEPDVSTWEDPRAECFRRATAPRDRRLWTWEVRCSRGPEPGEVMALALSRSAAAVLEDLHRQVPRCPTRCGSSTGRILARARSSTSLPCAPC